MSFPVFTDLRSMAGELESDPQYSKLGQAIRMALVAQSCVADLSQSFDCCKALHALLLSPRKKNTIERGATESSLLANAVMLYARATASTGQYGERGAIQIGEKLTPTQRADHDVLIEIRNRALAHVYTTEQIGGALWHDEIMFATELEGGGWRPGGGSRRVQFDRLTLDRLVRQLPVARELVKAKAIKRIEAVTRILNDDPLPIAAFETHQFDPIKKFGSAEAVQRILAGLVSGEAAFLA